MASLHQILSSNPRAWEDCAAFWQPGDAVLLADAAAGLVADPGFLGFFATASAALPVRALEADIAARGLQDAARRAGVRLVDDSGWVRMVCAHDRVLSWK